MEYRVEEATAVLSRTPTTLRALLDGVPDAWLDAREEPGKWSPLEVVGHMVQAEEDLWIPRARSIVERGEGAVFEPFDRDAHLDRFRDDALSDILALFEERRRESLGTLEAMRVDDELLGRRGRHPELGVVTLRQLLATWVAHDLAHLRQIARIMAKEYREAVGPWARYLRVMSE